MQREEQERWNAVLSRHWWGRGHYAVVKELIADSIRRIGKDDLRCLDIGCSGGLMIGFLKQFGKAYGFDISYDGLLYGADLGVVVQADAARIPFKEDAFDLVTILDVAEHADDDNILFEEAGRVARKDAVIFINVPAFPIFWRSHDVKYGHKRRYVRADIERLARKYFFKVEQIRYLHAHFVAPIFLSMLLDRFRGDRFGKRDDFISAGPIGDELLLKTLLLERRLRKYISVPCGISLFCVLRK